MEIREDEPRHRCPGRNWIPECQFAETAVQLLEPAARAARGHCFGRFRCREEIGVEPRVHQPVGTSSLFSTSIQTGWIDLSASRAPYTAALSSADSAAAETRTSPCVPDWARDDVRSLAARCPAPGRSCRRTPRQPPRR